MVALKSFKIGAASILCLVFLLGSVVSVNARLISEEPEELASVIVTAELYWAPMTKPESIIPLPQQIERLSYLPSVVDKTWKIAADLDNQYDRFTAEYLQSQISTCSDGLLELEIIDISECIEHHKGKNYEFKNEHIIVTSPHSDPVVEAIVLKRGIDIDSDIVGGFDQGYVLLIEPSQIMVLGDSDSGTFYGMVSLTWLLQMQDDTVFLPHVKIKDWPDLEVRGFYGGGKYAWEGETINTATQREKWIEVLTRYKYNLFTHSLLPLSVHTSQSATDAELVMQDYLRKRHFSLCADLSPMSIRGHDRNIQEAVPAVDVAMSVDNDGYLVPVGSGDSILLNPDLEVGGGEPLTPPDGWEFNNNDPLNDFWSIDTTDDKYHRSAKLTLKRDLTGMNPPQTSSFLHAYVHKTFGLLPPNRTYLLTFWAKKLQADNTSRNPQVTAVLADEHGNKCTQSALIAEGDNKWRQYRIAFSTHNEMTKLYIYSRAQSSAPLEFWVDEFELVQLDDKLANVVRTAHSELEVWNVSRKVKYREGSKGDYLLEEDGEFDLSYPLQGMRTRIRSLGRRIKPGDEVRVDYDFLVNFQGGNHEYVSFAEPLFHDLYDEHLLSGTLQNLDLDYIFIAMTEIRGMNRDRRARALGLQNHELLGRFINQVTDSIAAYKPNARVLIWDDMLNPNHNGNTEDYQIRYGGPPGATWQALEMLSRDNVVPLCWWYYDIDSMVKMANSPELYNSKGFRFIAGAFYSEGNIRNWSYICKQNGALGMIEHEFYDRITGMPLVANYAWNAAEEYSD